MNIWQIYILIGEIFTMHIMFLPRIVKTILERENEYEDTGFLILIMVHIWPIAFICYIVDLLEGE